MNEVSFEPKNYTVKVVPFLRENKDAAGAITIVPEYKRTSVPNERALAAGFKATDFFHLEISEQDNSNPLAGDVKPYTVLVFANREKNLFEGIELLLNTEGEATFLPVASKVAVLKNTLPGLLRKVPCKPYYATTIDPSTGREIRLRQNRKQPDGSYKEEDVIMKYVAYFLWEKECNKDQDQIKFEMAIDAIHATNWIRIEGSGVSIEDIENRKAENPEPPVQPIDPGQSQGTPPIKTPGGN